MTTYLIHQTEVSKEEFEEAVKRYPDAPLSNIKKDGVHYNILHTLSSNNAA